MNRHLRCRPEAQRLLCRATGRDRVERNGRVIPGLIGYLDGRPVGWISLGPREDYAKLKRSPVMKPVDDKPVWSIVCFYVDRQVYCTFIDDAPGAYLLNKFGTDNSMCSSDYPHDASTWPNSGKVIAKDMEDLRPEVLRKVLRDNLVNLYGLKVPSPLQS